MLATIRDDTRNALNIQHITRNSKRWDYYTDPSYKRTIRLLNRYHSVFHAFDASGDLRTTRDLYAPRPNGGMTRPPAPPIGLKVEEAMTSAEINAE